MSEDKASGAEAPARKTAPRKAATAPVGATAGVKVGGGMPGMPAGSGDTGPGTGVSSPPDVQARSADRLGAGLDEGTQVQPAVGLPRSSTDSVAGKARLAHNYTGNTHHSLIRGDTRAVIADPNSIFAAAAANATVRVVNFDVIQVFTYHGAKNTRMERLLYKAGARVSLAEAAGLAAAVTDGAAQRTAELAHQ